MIVISNNTCYGCMLQMASLDIIQIKAKKCEVIVFRSISWIPIAYPTMFIKVSFLSAKIAAGRRTTDQSLTTPVTRAVSALVRDMTRKTDRLSMNVHMQFKNNVNGGKFHETLSSIFGFSNNNQGIKRHRALQEKNHR
jgi:hypothetical protein